MSVDDNKKIARQVLEAINQRNFAVFDNQLVASNAVEHAVPPGMPETVDSAKQLIGMIATAFPDLHYMLEDEIAEGDKVVQRVMGHGTMKGPLFGAPPSNKAAQWEEIHVSRLQNGKIVEHWAIVDQTSMMIQIGMMPAPKM